MLIKVLTICFYDIIARVWSRCDYVHVITKQTAAFNYQIEVMFKGISTLKAIDSTEKSKKFPSQSSLQAFKEHICIYKKRKEHLEENQQVSSWPV